jgi:hypothetical protein
MMTERLTVAKLKAHLALVAFVLVAMMAITLTSAGIFSYVALNMGLEPDTRQASVQQAPFQTASPSSPLATSEGN